MVVAVLAWLRAIIFLHEIAHRAREIPGFELAWNALVGVPMGVPSLLYVGSHLSHHRSDRYGTNIDPEYASLATWGPARKLLFVASSAIAAPLLAIRWGLLAPASLLLPALRSLVVGRLSTLAINPGFIRHPPRHHEQRRWIAGELCATAFVWCSGLAVALGVMPPAIVVQWWLLISGVFVVNQARTVLAHRYASTGEPLDARGQLLDSLTLPERSWLAPLIAPVGLRYHALHHWAPGIPYHELGRVHRELVEGSPSPTPYVETLTRSLPSAFRAGLARPLDAETPPPA
jgi:fatty acid desaturase